MNSKTNLIDYYAKRAAEYERIYQKPERQKDLVTLRSLLQKTLKGCDILEVACGTGYWTEVVAKTANSITAADINEKVLQIARSKDYGNTKVHFKKCDAFKLDSFSGKFNAGLSAFWWSHIKKSLIRDFLNGFHSALFPNALVVFMDNKYVEGSSTPISRRDEDGNIYQSRALENGRQYEVIKNFPGKTELKQSLAGLAEEIKLVELTYYWFLSYFVKG
jgi:demethylmenaquinone methyltransferase/2-methoxy-6-polyprenyl-1,4-benzoquinol methylase